MIILLEPLEKATNFLSSASNSTIADICFLFIELMEHFNDNSKKNNFSQCMVASSIYQKLKEYWTTLEDSSTIATVLNPGTKLTLFEQEKITIAIEKVKNEMVNYNIPISESTISSTKNSTKNYFHQLKRQRIENSNILQTNTLPLSSKSNNEFDRYLALECNDDIIPLVWWQARSIEFLLLSQIARDYLSIQSTSVASEQSFSVASNTLTNIRNRLHSTTARASLCLKSWIKNNLGENN